MHCSPERQVALLRIIMALHRRGLELIQAGVPLARLRTLPSVAAVVHAKSDWGDGDLDALAAFGRRLAEDLDALGAQAGPALTAPAPP